MLLRSPSLRFLIPGLLGLGLAGPAVAQVSLPQLMAPAGTADAPRPVRAAPQGDAEIIGSIDTLPIEVVGMDDSGTWGRVRAGESEGWIPLAGLMAQADSWPEGGLPASLSCHGTEPFWSFHREGERITMTTPDSAPVTHDLRAVFDSRIEGDLLRAFIAGSDAGRMTAVLSPEACSDGMSDIPWGLSAVVILDGSNQSSRMLRGCCTIAR